DRDGEEHLDQAFEAARDRRPDLAATFDLLEPWLRDGGCDGARRFQQTSGMVMAKGVEDCAFYRYPRLTSLNEVGGDPSVFSTTVDDFHAAMARRQQDWPYAMTTLSTHDTKRGEDVRARIHVLAEAPHRWADALERLLELVPLPDPGFASLLWQAAIGAWPADEGEQPGGDWRSRLHGYAEKAMREAGDRTTWTEPDAAYEAAVHAAVDAALDREDVREVIGELLRWTVDPGWSNALAAKLVALTMPGVPDVYQGSELWEQSLVDPDNRRPVDHDLRRSMLAAGPGSLVGGLEDPGTAKLHVVATALRLRRDRPGLFTTYAAVTAEGPAADHVLAFDRGGALTVATRLPLGLVERGGWGDTRLDLPPGRWRDALTDRLTDGSVGSLLSAYPVALLVKED
ncbi:MAG: malto-oligosyltrehalose synthase, partial [Nocardioides sp.]